MPCASDNAPLRRRRPCHDVGQNILSKLSIGVDAPAEQRVGNIKTIGKHGESVMKALIAALALAALIAIPTFAPSATAAPMSPASSSFGSNGY